VLIEHSLEALTPNERRRLSWLSSRDTITRDVLVELDRVLASATFSRVHSAARQLLSFVVGMKLIGKDDYVKETTIAMRVFHEAPDYDSSQSSRVRMAAGDLRRRLERYYRVEGQVDPLMIAFKPASYVPTFGVAPVTISVSSFVSWEATPQTTHLGRTLAAEVALGIHRVYGSRVQIASGAASGCRFQLRGAFGRSSDAVTIVVALADHVARRVVRWIIVKRRRDNVLGACNAIGRAVGRCAVRAGRRRQ